MPGTSNTHLNRKRVNTLRGERTARRSCGDVDLCRRKLSRLAMSVLGVVLLVASGCSVAAHTPPPAAAYDSPTDLYRAIDRSGRTRVDHLGIHRFGTHLGMRREAHAQEGNFLAASGDGTLSFADGKPATNVIAGVFPDATARDLGVVFGGHLAWALGWPSIWQLRGPNWILWSIDRDALQAIRQSVGGKLSRTPPASSPTPAT
jgi:hypothetical protein